GCQQRAGDRAERRLARPRRTEQGQALVARQRGVDVVEGDHLVVARGAHLAHALHPERGCTGGGRLGHGAPPMADAGSTRRTRRRENAQPTTAAKSNDTTLTTRRDGVTTNGMEPAGMAASRASEAAMPMADATAVTSTA